jgi:hypothetical protein
MLLIDYNMVNCLNLYPGQYNSTQALFFLLFNALHLKLIIKYFITKFINIY